MKSLSAIAFFVLLIPLSVSAETIVLEPDKDCDIFEDATGSLSSGAGKLLAGRTCNKPQAGNGR
ncbi:MAG TPA: hypothetical protein EYN66_03190, partial [Myxococcales bacterium]|nr:hypothetical protein [Myxococcales bacterium]